MSEECDSWTVIKYNTKSNKTVTASKVTNPTLPSSFSLQDMKNIFDFAMSYCTNPDVDKEKVFEDYISNSFNF